MSDIYFLGGLPRSGNTLLSALLNQNPDIYVSPNSPLLNNLLNLESFQDIDQNSRMGDFKTPITNGLKGYANEFYQDITKPIILDRNKIWGSKESIFTAYKYITNTPKVIFTVRDIPSVLTSFLTLVGDTQDNFIDRDLRYSKKKPYGNQTQNDLRCDLLMNGKVGDCLSALTELLEMQIPTCLVEYDDLISNPQKELKDIYTFLGINDYKNDFNNVQKIEQENLSSVGLPSNLHDVRNTVIKISQEPNTILSTQTLAKYANLEFWRQK